MSFNLTAPVAMLRAMANLDQLERELPREIFATTHWSVVRAIDASSEEQAEKALARLCEAYWYPLYAYVRRHGYSAHDAEDLTQSFFANLLEKEGLKRVRQEKGKFRSFLLTSLKNFLANEWDRKKTIKRGGRLSIISWDDGSAESRYLREPSHDATPEKLFQQSWALTLIEKVMEQLRKEYAESGKGEMFEVLHPHLTGENESYAQAGAKLGMKEGTARMAVLRMRRHFGYLLRSEIAQTVSKPEELDDELKNLCASLGSTGESLQAI
jgi:RNA polymerase sigma factor (sigma-70 family)